MLINGMGVFFRFPVSIASIIPFVRASAPASPEDAKPDDPEKCWGEQYKKYMGFDPEKQTPAERLRHTWIGIYNKKGWEYDFLKMTATSGFIFGALIGAMAKHEEHRLQILKRYTEVQFDHKFLAERKMRDQTFLQNSKNGLKLGWRIGLFSGLLCFSTLSTLSYRHNINPLDFAAVFGVVGGIWNWKSGPRGILATASITGTFGLIVGSMSWAIMRMSGFSVAEFRLYLAGQKLKEELLWSRGFIERKRHDKENFGFLYDREMMLQQRRYEERMKQQEAELAAKQRELANVLDSEAKALKK